jgi:hypothetical protein
MAQTMSKDRFRAGDTLIVMVMVKARLMLGSVELV